MRALIVLMLFHLYVICQSKDTKDKLDRYIITCRTTDWECFKRQYIGLRDNVLFGNNMLGIPRYEPFTFQYGNSNTCIQLSGLEGSELVGISMNTGNKEYSIVLGFPLKIHQVANKTRSCLHPDKEFQDVGPHKGPFRRFTGNATAHIIYPFRLYKKKGDVYIKLQTENVDLILEIPDLKHFDMSSKLEAQMYEWSEWAYDAVQHIDAAEHFVLPLTTQLRVIMERLPLQRFLLLYPEEEYTKLNFKWLSTVQT